MKGKNWLLAFGMGIILPGLLFSVAEKMISPPVSDARDTTGETAQQTQTQTEWEGREDTAAVQVLLPDGTLQTMKMETYLTGVLLGEMPADFEMEALKAQAVVARTYALKRSALGDKHAQKAVCTQAACCQAYCSEEQYLTKGGSQAAVSKVLSAVQATAGQVLTYRGNLIEATYFSCSGGRTEDAQAVWGTDIPYLQAVDSPGEEMAAHYSDSVRFTAKEFAARLGISSVGSPTLWLGAVTYTDGGGVASMVIGGKSFGGTALRSLLGLRSTVFTVTATEDTVQIVTKGFGHRVGMSQYGAEAMAVQGSGYEKILSHYYPGTALKTYTQN